MVRDIYAAWIMYIYIYMDIEYKGKSSTVAVRIWDVSACEWFCLMATWDVCFRVFFCFHSWFRTCVPCLYLDHLGPPCLKGGVLKAVRPSPSWVSSPRALFLIDFFQEKEQFRTPFGCGRGSRHLKYAVLSDMSFFCGRGSRHLKYAVLSDMSFFHGRGSKHLKYAVLSDMSFFCGRGSRHLKYAVLSDMSFFCGQDSRHLKYAST